MYFPFPFGCNGSGEKILPMALLCDKFVTVASSSKVAQVISEILLPSLATSIIS